MTLFIASLLIYRFDMAWWWYGVAVAIWFAHLYTYGKSFLDIYLQGRAPGG